MSKRSLACSLLVALLAIGLAVLSYSSASADNGAPSGPHYNLNILGVKDGQEKNINFDGGNGHRIFVALGTTGVSSNTKILLKEGPFEVIDANGTDGVAIFQLPNPDPNNDGITVYSAYVRGLGNWHGDPKAIITPAFTDASGTYYSLLSVKVERKQGQSKFTNVSKELLYVFADINGDGTVDRIPLFGKEFADFFWSYDNFGLKLAQLRFYPIPTIIN